MRPIFKKFLATTNLNFIKLEIVVRPVIYNISYIILMINLHRFV